ncbi:unnamed protein product [Orchesella dallaii]|uniref:Uncharacterized protein n=1 Tax=Orchesella dallaii TaxID=48710 RepID=A0ABP1PTR0_9HEXA
MNAPSCNKRARKNDVQPFSPQANRRKSARQILVRPKSNYFPRNDLRSRSRLRKTTVAQRPIKIPQPRILVAEVEEILKSRRNNDPPVTTRAIAAPTKDSNPKISKTKPVLLRKIIVNEQLKLNKRRLQLGNRVLFADVEHILSIRRVNNEAVILVAAVDMILKKRKVCYVPKAASDIPTNDVNAEQSKNMLAAIGNLPCTQAVPRRQVELVKTSEYWFIQGYAESIPWKRLRHESFVYSILTNIFRADGPDGDFLSDFLFRFPEFPNRMTLQEGA